MERSHLVDAPFQGRELVLDAIQLPSNWERLALAASTRPRRRRTRVPGLAAGEHGVPSTNRRAERFGHVIRALSQGGVESRSEERRVGKECVSKGRFRGWQDNIKK